MLTQIIIAGSGGQGIQFAGQVLAQAAACQDLLATYVPAYGAERRGGPSHCFVVLADRPIYAPVFESADILLAFDQRGQNQYASQVKPDGIILANADLAADPSPDQRGQRIALRASAFADTASTGGALNLVMLGAYLGLFKTVDLACVKRTIEQKSARRPELLRANLAALEKGLAWAQGVKP